MLDEAGDGDGGAGEDAGLDLLGALLHAVEVERVADRVGELVHALLEHGAGGGHEVGVALDLLERREQADVAHPLAGVLGVRPRRSASVWTIASRPPAAARVNRQPLALATATLVSPATLT